MGVALDALNLRGTHGRSLVGRTHGVLPRRRVPVRAVTQGSSCISA